MRNDANCLGDRTFIKGVIWKNQQASPARAATRPFGVRMRLNSPSPSKRKLEGEGGDADNQKETAIDKGGGGGKKKTERGKESEGGNHRAHCPTG